MKKIIIHILTFCFVLYILLVVEVVIDNHLFELWEEQFMAGTITREFRTKQDLIKLTYGMFGAVVMSFYFGYIYYLIITIDD